MKEDQDNRDPSRTSNQVFQVNKHGFPLVSETLEALWCHVEDIHPDGQQVSSRIRGCPTLPHPAIPVPPILSPSTSIEEKLALIQQYMERLQYNHTGMQFFEIKKYRPISGLMEVAKEIIKEALPIKCLEATVLSLYLTSGINEIDRFTISFKSQFGNRVHRHIVLGVRHGNKYGALGLSRRKQLMYKPLHFKTLAKLIFSFKEAYEECHHSLRKVKLSAPVPHDTHSCDKICWKYLDIPIAKMTTDETKTALDKFSKEIRTSF